METRGTIHLFGKPAFIVGDRDLAAEMPAKGLALIGYLCMEPGWHRREQISGLLWGETDDSRARANLRTLLYELKNLVPGLLEIGRHAVRYDPDCGYRVDLVEARARMDSEDPEDLWVFSETLGGRFLEQFLPERAPGFEDWLRPAQETWQRAAVSRLERLVDALDEAREDARAVQALNRILAVEPWNEPAHRRLIHRYALRGDYAAAVDQYRRLEETLERELAVAPDSETTALYARVRRSRERRRLQFPAQPNPFFGRETEIRRLTDLLRRPEPRLVSVLGPGGVGKTRLALRAAEAAGDLFLDGARLVPLADWSAGHPIVSPLAQALEISGPPRGDLRAALLGFLQDREILLVLDNFEHLIGEGEFLAEILAGAPGVKLLVTSREALGLRWEHRLVLEGLPVPAGGDPAWAAFPSAALFIDSAARIDPGFSPEKQAEAVISVSRAVEGFPLALEIAAALTGELKPGRIAERVRENLAALETKFRDVPERQRSLLAVFEASWELLDRDLQALLARLSVFRGGFDLQAAAAVAGAGPERLDRLVRKSLLRLSDGRFTFHELVRWFAAQKQAGSPSALAAADGHAGYFAVRIRLEAEKLFGHTLQGSLAAIRLELANLKAAWGHALERRETGLLHSMLGGLVRFFDLAGEFDEGETLFSAAAETLAAAGLPDPAGRRLIADLRNAEARFLNRLGRFGRAVEIVEPVAGDPALGDETRAFAYLEWGWALWHTGRYAEAQAPLEAAQGFALRAENPLLIAHSFRNLGIIAWYRSAFDEARRYAEQALAYHEQIGDLQGVGDVYNNLALIAGNQGDYAASLAFLTDSIRIKHEIGDLHGEQLGKNNLTVLHMFLGQYAQAAALLDETIALTGGSVNPVNLTYSLIYRSELSGKKGLFGPARDDALEALSLARRAGDRALEAYALQLAGSAMMHLGEADRADALFEESLSLRRESGRPEMVFESLIQLAAAALQRGRPERAGAFAGEMRAMMDAGEVKNPRILLEGLFTCHRVLAARGSSEAAGFLALAHGSLHEQADAIIDPDLRRSFLENIPLHVEIEEAWSAG